LEYERAINGAKELFPINIGALLFAFRSRQAIFWAPCSSELRVYTTLLPCCTYLCFELNTNTHTEHKKFVGRKLVIAEFSLVQYDWLMRQLPG
jgi:hypothetical protein